jgi:hypothetical protein
MPAIAELCPDAFALECVAAFRAALPREILENAIAKAGLSPATVTLLNFLGRPIRLPVLPKTVEECWRARGVVCGAAEYVVRTRDYTMLVDLLPCLHAFTDPAADMICEVVFEIRPISERPIDPVVIFERLATVPAAEVSKLLRLASFFPLRFALPVFGRSDLEEISPAICEFLDAVPDPLPPDSLRPFDLSGFFDRFLFDTFFIPACQRLCYFFIAGGAHPEVRQHFWSTYAQYLSRFVIEKHIYGLSHSSGASRNTWTANVSDMDSCHHFEKPLHCSKRQWHRL